MFLIGLTGGIAAGKSTVAKVWQDLGATQIDADDLARTAVAKGSKGLQAVIDLFGEDYLTDEGELDRKALGELVFVDAKSRAQLENIIHPLVREALLTRLAELPPQSRVVYTVPLLVEAKVDLPFDVIVTVEAPEDIRIERLITSRGLTRKQAEARIMSQARPIERAAVADYILNSNQPLDQLIKDAKSLWENFADQPEN